MSEAPGKESSVDDLLEGGLGPIAHEAAHSYGATAEYRYRAFISYGRDGDGDALTVAVYRILNQLMAQHAPKRSSPPRVFIDRVDLAVGGPGLRPDIYAALEDSQYLILIVSRATAGSPWVPDEVAYWLEKGGSLDRVTFVVLDAAKEDPSSMDLALDQGLPAGVRGRFAWGANMPLMVNLRDFGPQMPEPVKNPQVRELVAQLAARLIGITSTQVVDEDIRQRRRAERLRTLLTATLAVLLVAALVGASAAFVEWRSALAAKQSAVDQRNRAVAVGLAAQAGQLESDQPNLAAQLALTAYRTAPGEVAAQKAVLESAGLPGSISLALGTLVVSSAVSPDGRLLAATQEQGTTTRKSGQLSALTLWDLRTHRIDWVYDHIETTTPVAFTANGRVLALIGVQNDVELWNVADPTHPSLLVSIPPAGGSQSFIASTLFALSPDGRTLAVFTSASTSLWIWDVSDPSHATLYSQPPASAAARASAYEGGAFTPDGRTLIIITLSGHAQVWNIADPQAPSVIAQLQNPRPGQEYVAVAVSPDGRSLAIAAHGDILLWDITVPAHPVGPVSALQNVNTPALALAFSPDGTVLAFAGTVTGASAEIDCLRVTGPGAVKPLATLPDPGSSPTTLAFGPDDDSLYAGNIDGTVASWHLPLVRGPGDVPAAGVANLAYSLDGALLAGADADGTTWLWDARDPHHLKLRTRLPAGGSAATAVRFAPAPRHLLATGAQDGSVRLWNLADAAHPILAATLPPGAGKVSGVAFDHSGNLLAVGGWDGAAVLWDLTDPAKPVRLSTMVLQGGVWGVDFAPSGRFLAVSGQNGVLLWNLADPRSPVRTGQIVFAQLGYQVAVYSPDGRFLACAGLDGQIQLWNVTDAAEPVQVGDLRQEGMTAVAGLAFSPDGATLVSVDAGALRFWSVADLSQAESIGVLPQTGNLDTVAVDPVGGYAAAGGLTGAVVDAPYDRATAAAAICTDTGSAITPSQWTQYVPVLRYSPPCAQPGARS